MCVMCAGKSLVNNCLGKGRDTIKWEKKQWIIRYISQNEVGSVDTLNSDFVDAYIKEFNALVNIQPVGANKCPEINEILSEMYHEGILNRSAVGVGGLGVGYPKWVYVYSLRAKY